MFSYITQQSSRVGVVLRRHHATQSPAAPRWIQDGRPSRRWATEDGSPLTEKQCEVPRHHDRLFTDSGLRQPRKQGKVREPTK